MLENMLINLENMPINVLITCGMSWSMCWSVRKCVDQCVDQLRNVLIDVLISWDICWSVCWSVEKYVDQCVDQLRMCWSMCWSIEKMCWSHVDHYVDQCVDQLYWSTQKNHYFKMHPELSSYLVMRYFQSRWCHLHTCKTRFYELSSGYSLKYQFSCVDKLKYQKNHWF